MRIKIRIYNPYDLDIIALAEAKGFSVSNAMKQTLKYIYERLFENLKYAETKHSITMTIATAVIAFASTFFSLNKIINILQRK